MRVKSRCGLATILLMVLFCVATYAGDSHTGPVHFVGTWMADLTLSSVQTTPVSAFRSRLDNSLSLGPLTLSTRSDFSEDGWLWQSLSIGADIAFLSFSAEVLYAPDPWAFCYLSGVERLDFGAFWLAHYMAFLGSVFDGEMRRGSIVEIGTMMGGFSLAGYCFFGANLDGLLFSMGPGYSLCLPGDVAAPSVSERYYRVVPVQTSSLAFTGAEILATWRVCYDIDVTSSTVFSPAGFEYQEFQAVIWSIGLLPFNLDVRLRFELQSKALSVEPKIGLGNRYCYGRALVELISSGPIGLIDGFSIYGLDLFMMGPSFAVRSLTVFDQTNYSLYRTEGMSLLDDVWVDRTGGMGVCGSAGEELPDYWQLLGFGVYRGEPCCRMLSFTVLTFFGDSGSLFDWMRTEFRVALKVAEGLEIRAKVALDSTGVPEWTMGLSVSW